MPGGSGVVMLTDESVPVQIVKTCSSSNSAFGGRKSFPFRFIQFAYKYTYVHKYIYVYAYVVVRNFRHNNENICGQKIFYLRTLNELVLSVIAINNIHMHIMGAFLAVKNFIKRNFFL